MLVSIILPVFNGAKPLSSAIKSILDQTYANFELIVINDGSSDESSLVAKQFRDPRVVVIDLPTNQGLINALNVGLEQARGRFVARMDHDDIAHPERIQLQVNTMHASEAVICGAAIQPFGAIRGKPISYPLTDTEIRAVLPVVSPFAHPTVMMITSVCRRLRYSITARHCEDYDLWWRIAGEGRMINLPEVLLRYRYHANQISTTQRAAQLHGMAWIACDNLRRIGRIRSDSDLELHKMALTYQALSSLEQLEFIGDWVSWLRNSYGDEASEIDRHYLRVWRGVCSRQSHLGNGVWKIYRHFVPQKLRPMSDDMIVWLTAHCNFRSDSKAVGIIRRLLRR